MTTSKRGQEALNNKSDDWLSTRRAELAGSWWPSRKREAAAIDEEITQREVDDLYTAEQTAEANAEMDANWEIARMREERYAQFDIEYADALGLTDEQLAQRESELEARDPYGVALGAVSQIREEREKQQEPNTELAAIEADRAAAAAEAAAELLAERRAEQRRLANATEHRQAEEAHQAGRSTRGPDHAADHSL